MKSWTSKGQALLETDASIGAALYPSFWRPPTDNDVPLSLPYWKRHGVDQLTSQLRSMGLEAPNPHVVVKVHTFIAPPALAWGWDCEVEYTIRSDGSLRVFVTRLKPSGPFPAHVPRIGLNLRLNKALDKVEWHGRGPGESYPDKRAAQHMGIWAKDSVSEMQTAYDVPQENGNRSGTRWVKLTSHASPALGIRAERVGEEPYFDFAASHHSTETVQAARHPTDLVDEEATLLKLDARVAGVGTAACGPGVREDLLVKCEPALGLS